MHSAVKKASEDTISLFGNQFQEFPKHAIGHSPNRLSAVEQCRDLDGYAISDVIDARGFPLTSCRINSMGTQIVSCTSAGFGCSSASGAMR